MAAPNRKADAGSEALAWQVAAKYEPRIRAAVEAALTDWQDSVNTATVQAYVISGDLAGLGAYLSLQLAEAAAPMIAALDETVIAAGRLAEEDVNRHLAQFGRRADNQIPFAPDAPAGIVFQGVTPEFSYNPVNPTTIRAVRTWQGNLIQQMSSNARTAIMDIVREGLLNGDNPRTMARAIRRDLTLTSSQQAAVRSYSRAIDTVIGNGISSAQTWGIYTPRQIADLKARDRALFRQLNFTPREVAEGRRWGKISRAAGTLRIDPKTGLKPSKPLGFVAPPSTQGGENAFRLGPDGRVLDRVTSWRLRDKRLDPKIFNVVRAEEDLHDAHNAVAAARTAAEKEAAATRLARATAAHGAARQEVAAAQGQMVDNYRARMLKHRSQTIARTEAMRAANLGSYEAWRQTIDDSDLFEPNELRREIVTARDDRVRESHQRAGGQTRGIHEPFTVGGVSHMFPPFDVDCRCTVAYRIKLGGW